MNDAGIDIDRIVREVVQRLRDHLATPTNGHSSDLQKTTIAPGELKLDEKLVTLSTLEGRLGQVQRVVVRTQAVVTPAARDFLKEKKITILRSDRQELSKPTKSAATAQVIVAVETIETASLAKLLGHKIHVTTMMPNTSDALTHATACAAGGGRAALLTDAPAAAVMQANRNPTVRAALGYNYPAIRHAIDQIDANLLVLQPAARSTTEVGGMLGEFFRERASTSLVANDQ